MENDDLIFESDDQGRRIQIRTAADGQFYRFRISRDGKWSEVELDPSEVLELILTTASDLRRNGTFTWREATKPHQEDH